MNSLTGTLWGENESIARDVLGARAVPPCPDEPLYAIGDLHGRADLIAPMMNAIDADIAAQGLESARIVFLGDYIDHGDRSAVTLAVLKRLTESDEGDVICLMGGHERMMLDFLDAPATRGARWLKQGGLQTLASFGIEGVCTLNHGHELEAAAASLRAALPAGLENWLRARPMLWQSGNVVCRHAVAERTGPAGRGDKVLLLGQRDAINAGRRDGIWVVHGHTVVKRPIAGFGRISVDTGAFFTGQLSAAAILPGQPVRFLGVTDGPR